MLQMNNIYKTFNVGTVNEKTALRNLSLTLEDGDFVTVIGGNGAGKSTMLNAIAGTWPVDNGSIVIDGLEVSTLNPKDLRHLRQKIGMIFQHFSLLARKNVYENIILPLQCANIKIDSKKIKNLLKEM